MKYELELAYKFPAPIDWTNDKFDALYEAGLDDAVIGSGVADALGIVVGRDGETRDEAVESVTVQVKKVFPDATLESVKEWPPLDDA